MVERGQLVDVGTQLARIELPGDVRIVVSQVKSSFCSEFESREGREMVEKARGSYDVYGDVPRLDDYDAKSTVYIARTFFPLEDGSLAEEIVTMRLVPANGRFGHPSSTEDIDMTVFVPNDGRVVKSTWEVLSDKEIELESVATISRLGVVPAEDQERNYYLAEAFAVIQEMAVQDARGYGVRWIMCQLHPSLQYKSLAYKDKTLDFVPAERQLGLEEQGQFGLNRWNEDVWRYILSYPGYFLNMDGLKRLLTEKMSGSNLIDLGLLEGLTWKNVKELVPVLLASGEERVSGELTVGELRELIKGNVRDAMFLALMGVDDWEKSAYDLRVYSSRDRRGEFE